MNEFHLTAHNRDQLKQKIDQLDPHVIWFFQWREKKSKRSNQQNSRYWLFLQGFGKHLGYTKDEMHDLCRYKFLFDVVEVNGERMRKLRSTPKTNTAEFSEYQEQCEMWAAGLGYVFDDWQA